MRCLEKLGIRPEIFMAPGHSFDKNTLRALKECGFRFVTDGFGDAPYLREGLIFLPISFLRKQELKKENGVTTFVVHTWDMSEEEFRWYEDLFANRRERILDYRSLTELPARKRRRRETLGEYGMAAGKKVVARI